MRELRMKSSRRTITESEMRLSGSDIVSLLQRLGFSIPDDASVDFRVPGGGDWSNTEVCVDDVCPVIVSWATTEVK